MGKSGFGNQTDLSLGLYGLLVPSEFFFQLAKS